MKFPYWTTLPAEIRLLILEAITQQKHPGWASSAAVCKEWQFVCPLYLARYRAAMLHVPMLLLIRVRDVGAAKLVHR